MGDLQEQRVLVTGGGGFVGVPTVRALLAEGAQVRVLDLSGDALEGLDCEVVTGSVTDLDTVRRACEGVQRVVHLAVLPLTAANTEVDQAFEINVLGCFNVFRAAGDAGAERVVYSSASSAYGPTAAVPIPPDHPLEPLAFYPATKAAGEMLLHGLAGTYGYDFVVLRYMNVYGPGQQAGVVPAVARALLAGDAPTLTGDGTQAFDFVHIDDCARANTLALGAAASRASLNVGSGEATSLNDVVALMCDLLGVELQPSYSGDVSSAPPRVGDLSRSRELIGYEATMPLRDGLATVLDHMRQGEAVASGEG
jgi:nucleoside-diphosphate-sugar epimerase